MLDTRTVEEYLEAVDFPNHNDLMITDYTILGIYYRTSVDVIATGPESWCICRLAIPEGLGQPNDPRRLYRVLT